MQLADITVEVRDKTLKRLGLIRPEDLDLELSDLHNNVGSWKLALAAEHPLADALRQPGSGIIVTGPDDVLFSGPTLKPEFAATETDPGGTVTFEGVDDTVILADVLAAPEPTNPNLAAQTLAHDVRTGPIETLMHAFVNANIGPAAPAARRGTGTLASFLVMGTNGGRGPSTTKSARFPVLGNLLADMAAVANLGFRVVQRGANLVFETYAVLDRSREVRLDIYNNTLSAHKVAMSPPGATQVLVAGQGEMTDRQFLALNTPESVAAEAQWGRRIERFVDQRNTADWDELNQAGMEVLVNEGFTSLAIQVVPMEDTDDFGTMRFGKDWTIGDKVAVVVEGQELASIVTGYVLKANKDGFKLGALIGDAVGFDDQAAIGKRVQNTETRVSALERNAENNAPGVKYLAPADFNQATMPGLFPQGESLLYLGATDATNGGWTNFVGKVGTVRTINPAGTGYASQTWQLHAATTEELWMRGGHPSNGWSAWVRLATTTDTAANAASITSTANDLAVMSIMGAW